MNVEVACDVHVQGDEREMKRGTSHRLPSSIERKRVKKRRCSVCGSDEWLCKVESYVLHSICRHCGFQLKEMMSE